MKEKNVEENPRGINASEFQLINNQNRELQILQKCICFVKKTAQCHEKKVNG